MIIGLAGLRIGRGRTIPRRAGALEHDLLDIDR